MRRYTMIKQRVVEVNLRGAHMTGTIMREFPETSLDAAATLYPGWEKDDVARHMADRIALWKTAASWAMQSQTIIFSAKQAEIFCDVIAKKQLIPLDFHLPFPATLIQFDQPITLHVPDTSIALTGLLLVQYEVDQEKVEKIVERDREESDFYGVKEKQYEVHNLSPGETLVYHMVLALNLHYTPLRVTWHSRREELLALNPDGTLGPVPPLHHAIRSLAVACIGYINCENIYLHKEGEVTETVNAKRERKGKSQLEPYYVCRIRGVQYEGPIHKGTGAEHSFRYDVRGHFRRLDTGKVIWVHPHQRGLKHELYIPKVYEVESREQRPPAA